MQAVRGQSIIAIQVILLVWVSELVDVAWRRRQEGRPGEAAGLEFEIVTELFIENGCRSLLGCSEPCFGLQHKTERQAATGPTQTTAEGVQTAASVESRLFNS